MTPPNTDPSVGITAPPNGTTVDEGTSLTFTAGADDDQDGNISANIVWSSNQNGGLGAGASVSARLPVGTHVITASITDSGGLSAND